MYGGRRWALNVGSRDWSASLVVDLMALQTRSWPDCAAEDKASRYKILQIQYALFYQDVVMKHASIQIVFIVLGEKRKTWSCNHFNIVSTLARARITDGYYSGNMDAVLTDHVRE